MSLSIKTPSIRHKMGRSLSPLKNDTIQTHRVATLQKATALSHTKECNTLGVLNREVANVINKVASATVLSTSILQKKDFDVLKKHNFIVVEDSDKKIEAIANKTFLLGKGSYKLVYRAYQLQTGIDVALGIARGLKDSSKFSSEVNKELAFAEDFKEYDAMFILPRKVFIANTSDSALLMPLAQGQSIKDKMSQGNLTASQGAAFTKQLLVATQIIHDKGWIHRDLKPANLLIGQDGALKICDYGLAKKAAYVRSAGSPGYLAPEFVASDDYIGTNRVDSFSVGVVIYNMLSASTRLPRSKRNSGDEDYTAAINDLLKGLDKKISELENKTKPNEIAEWEFSIALRGLLEIDPEKRISVQQALDLLPDDEQLLAIFEKYSEKIAKAH